MWETNGRRGGRNLSKTMKKERGDIAENARWQRGF